MPTPTTTPTDAEPRSSFAARHPHLLALVAAAALLVVFVASPKALGAIQDKHFEGHWRLSEAPAGVPNGLPLTVQERQMFGEGPCNGFSGGWTRDEGPTGGLQSTLASCGSATDAVENSYFHRLTSTTSVHLVSGQLVLEGPRGRLVYDRQD